MKGAKVGGWGNFFTEGNKGNEAGGCAVFF
jgi:hypothetical protein